MTEEDNSDAEGMLVLVKGQGAAGEPQYAYAIITHEKYEAFLGAQTAGAYDLSAFGVILCHGAGREPPVEKQKEMEDKYGALHDFEQRIISDIKTTNA